MEDNLRSERPARPWAIRAAVTFTAVVLAVVTLYCQARQLSLMSLGLDFRPLRAAAGNLLHWRPIYAERSFVYPPTAAVILAPTAAGTFAAAVNTWTTALGVVLAVTGGVLGRWAPAGWRLAAGAGGVTLIAGGMAAFDSLRLGNASALLAPVALAVVAAAARGRWLPSTLLLAASALLKPVLAPLVLLPVAARKWRQIAGAGLVAGAVAFVAMVVLPGGMRVDRFVGYVASGTNLHGALSVHSLTVGGLAETYGVPVPVAWVARALVVAVAGWFARRALTCPAGADIPALAVTVFTALLLAGPLAEVSYLPALAALAGFAALRQGRWPAAAAYLPGLAVIGAPLALFCGASSDFMPGQMALQILFVTAEAALLAAGCINLVVTRGGASTPRQPVQCGDCPTRAEA